MKSEQDKFSNSKKKDTAQQPSDESSSDTSERNERNFLKEQTIIKENPMAYDTQYLKQYLKKNPKIQSVDTTAKPDNRKPWENDRKNGAKVYELIGYTTAGKINQKSDRENRQFYLKRILIVILLLVIFILAIIIINPIKDRSDWKRILGLDSYFADDNQTHILENEDSDNFDNSMNIKTVPTE